MDIVALKNAAPYVRRIGRAAAQPLDRCRLVAEGLQERERERPGIERFAREL